MNPADEAREEDELASLRAAYDAALAAGQSQEVALPASATPALRARWRRSRALLELLEWDRRGAVASTMPQLTSDMPTPTVPSWSAATAQLGRLEIRGELGRGGYGIVYLAFDPRLNREVAVKVPRPEVVLTAALRDRFLREARTAAALQHPNLVPVHDVGEAGAFCYLVSAYCLGGSLADRLKRNSTPISPTTAVVLMAQIADAVAYIHDRGVLHRDIKPSNILLSAEPLVPSTETKNADSNLETPRPTLETLTPKLADFGLAKLLENAGHNTQTGDVLGTPAYMAPEQAAGRSRELTAAVDVYGIGAVLYELLSGRSPFRGESNVEILRQVVGDEPTGLRRLRREIPRDLETICLKCLEKEPRQRYATAADLAADLRRFLAGESIHARPAKAWERGWKCARRRPAMVAALALGVTAVFLLADVAWQRRVGEQTSVENRRLTAEHATVQSERWAIARQTYVLHMAEIGRAWTAGDRDKARGWPSDLRPILGASDVHGFEWSYISDLLRQETNLLHGHRGSKLRVAYAPDGATLATAADDATVRLWDAATTDLLHTLRGHSDAVTGLHFSPDGVYLASSSADGTVKTWDVRTGAQLATLTGPGTPLLRVAISPDGRWLAASTTGANVLLWDRPTASPRVLGLGRDENANGLAFTPDSALLAVGFEKAFAVWDVATGRKMLIVPAHAEKVLGLAFSPDGHLLATGSWASGGALWDTATWQRRAEFATPGLRVSTVAFSPNGQTLAVGGQGEDGKRKEALLLYDVPAVLEAERERVIPKIWELATRTVPKALNDARVIRIDSKGNFLVLARFSGDFTLGNGPSKVVFTGSRTHTERDCSVIAKFTSSGNLAWVRWVEGFATISDLVTDATDHVYVTGRIHGKVQFGPNPWTLSLTKNRWSNFVLKLGPDGTLVWHKELEASGRSVASKLALDRGGNLHVAGCFEGTIDLDPGPNVVPAISPGTDHHDLYVVKLDREGRFLWGRTAAGQGRKEISGLDLDGSGGVYVSGRFPQEADFDTSRPKTHMLTGAGNEDGFLWKLDRHGSVCWVRGLVGAASDQITNVAWDGAGHVYITGYFESKALVGKEGRGAVSLAGAAGESAFLAKLDLDGNVVWARCLGSASYASGVGLAVDRQGRPLVSGTFGGTMSFVPGDESPSLVASRPDMDCFVLKVDSDGYVFWARSINSSEECRGVFVCEGPDGHLYVAGYCGSHPKLSNDDGVIWTAGDSKRNGFVAKFLPPRRQQVWGRFSLESANVEGLAFSPNGRKLAVGCTDSLVRLGQPKRPDEIPDLSTGPGEARAVAFSSDGMLVTGSDDAFGEASLRLWNVATRQLLRTFSGHAGMVTCVAFSPDGQTIASGSLDHSVRLWDAATGRQLSLLDGHTDSVRCLAFSRDGRFLATGSHDRSLILWDVASKAQIWTKREHEHEVNGAAFTHDGGRLISTSTGTTIRMWEVATGQTVRILQNQVGTGPLTVAPDGKTFATGDKAGNVKLCDVASGQVLLEMTARHLGGVHAIAFTPDGRTLTSAGEDRIIRLSDPTTGIELLTLRGHATRINALAFSPDGQLLASASQDGAVKLWPAPDRRQSKRP